MAAAAEISRVVQSTGVTSFIEARIRSSLQLIEYLGQSMRQQRSGMPGQLKLEDGAR